MMDPIDLEWMVTIIPIIIFKNRLTFEVSYTYNLIFCSQAILELNATELSHSQDHVGAEVFAEPYSFICLMGTKPDESSQQDKPSYQNEEQTLDLVRTANGI